MKTNKGQITLGLGILWTTIFTTFSIAGAYFSNQANVAGKINETAVAINANISTVTEKINADISEDRQRLSSLEEAIKTIKENSVENTRDIKEILKILK